MRSAWYVLLLACPVGCGGSVAVETQDPATPTSGDASVGHRGIDASARNVRLSAQDVLVLPTADASKPPPDAGLAACPAADAALGCSRQADCPADQICCAGTASDGGDAGSPQCLAVCYIERALCLSDMDCLEVGMGTALGCTGCGPSCTGPYHLCFYSPCMR
jgi:hypothetical protein